MENNDNDAIKKLRELAAKRFNFERKSPGVIRWLDFEQDLRDALEAYDRADKAGFRSQEDHVAIAELTLKFVSDALGYHTGRGYILRSLNQWR